MGLLPSPLNGKMRVRVGWKRWDGIPQSVCVRDGTRGTSWRTRSRGAVRGHQEVPRCPVAPFLSQGEMQEEQVKVH